LGRGQRPFLQYATRLYLASPKGLHKLDDGVQLRIGHNVQLVGHHRSPAIAGDLTDLIGGQLGLVERWADPTLTVRAVAARTGELFEERPTV
jgi:hypothetical protein